MFVKITGTRVKKQKHLLQIPVQELHNYMILPIYEGAFLVQEKLMENYLLDMGHLVSIHQNILNHWATEIRLHMVRNLYKCHDTSIRSQ